MDAVVDMNFTRCGLVLEGTCTRLARKLLEGSNRVDHARAECASVEGFPAAVL